jgi:hypothetical protein
MRAGKILAAAGMMPLALAARLPDAGSAAAKRRGPRWRRSVAPAIRELMV